MVKETDRHLDLLTLDELRTRGATPGEKAHLDGCEECRASLDAFSRAAALLAAGQPPVPSVPPAVDRAVMEAFRRRFRPKVRWVVPAAGVAAAAALVLTVSLQNGGTPARVGSSPALPSAAPSSLVIPGLASSPAVPAISGDLNGDGRVDILDAFSLAKAVKAGNAPLSDDMNRDGRADQFDVDLLARRAVAL